MNDVFYDPVADTAPQPDHQVLIRRLRSLQRAVDHSGVAVYWAGRNLAFLYVNDVACRMLGFRREELLTLSVPDVAPDFGRRFSSAEAFWGELTRQGALTVETEHRKKNGKRVPVQVFVSHVAGADGEFACGIVHDVSQRRIIENRQRLLAHSYQSLRLLSASNDSLVRARDEPELLQRVCNLIIDVGNYAMAWVGYPDSDRVRIAAYANAADGRPPGHRDGPWQDALRSGRTTVADDIGEDPGYGHAVVALPLLRSDQRLGVLVVHAAPGVPIDAKSRNLLTKLAGNLAFGIAALRARREREESLAAVGLQSRQQAVLTAILKVGLETAPLPDQLQRILDILFDIPWLPAMRHLGIFLVDPSRDHLTLAAHRNLPDRLLTSCSVIPVGQCHCGRAAQTGLVVFSSLVDRCGMRYEDGEHYGHFVVPVMFSDQVLGLLLVRLEPGHPYALPEENFLVAVASTLAGIVKRGRMEEAADRLMTELGRARRLLTMGEMSSILAHQINQPLVSVTNYAEGCLKRLSDVDCPAEQIRFGLQQVLEETRRAADIIQNLRNFLRRGEPNAVATNSVRLVSALEPVVRPLLDRYRTRLALDLADPQGCIRCDTIQIQEVLLNLIRNGLEAMESLDPAERRLRIAAAIHGDQMRISVINGGRGLPPALRAELVNPFFTTKNEGMGIGLSICRSIVEAHKGRLWATAGDGGDGTAVHFTLPICGEGAGGECRN